MNIQSVFHSVASGVALIGCFLFVGCTGAKVRSDSNAAEISQMNGEKISFSDSSNTSDLPPRFVGSSRVGDQGELIVLGVKLNHTKYDFPITLNSRVEFWVDYFTGKGRKHFEKYLARSEFFIPYIQPILVQNGLPEDLVYLAMIESGFNNHARSHAKAVGPWQFISATGKRYGLMVNWWVDERRDTRKSTFAAVEYLRELYSMFRSWELAAAAYNAGEAKIARAIRRYGTKDFWSLTRHTFLRQETRDYVPKIIAAALVAKNRVQFGFPAPKVEQHQGEVIAGDGELVNLSAKPSEDEEARSNSPTDSIEKILAEEASEEGGAPVVEEEEELSPTGRVSVVVNSLEEARPIPTPHVNKVGEVSGEDLLEFEVQSPSDLLKIAQASGLSYSTVKALNPEILRWCTPPSVGTYRIRLPVSVKNRFLSAYNSRSFGKKVHFLAYRVRRGDSLGSIARRFGIKADPMVDLNGVSAKALLRTGSKVYLPIPDDRSRSIASLEVRDSPERRRYKRTHRRSSSRIYRVSMRGRELSRSLNQNTEQYID